MIANLARKRKGKVEVSRDVICQKVDKVKEIVVNQAPFQYMKTCLYGNLVF